MGSGGGPAALVPVATLGGGRDGGGGGGGGVEVLLGGLQGCSRAAGRNSTASRTERGEIWMGVGEECEERDTGGRTDKVIAGAELCGLRLCDLQVYSRLVTSHWVERKAINKQVRKLINRAEGIERAYQSKRAYGRNLTRHNNVQTNSELQATEGQRETWYQEEKRRQWEEDGEEH
jgi:hypothetical protein